LIDVVFRKVISNFVFCIEDGERLIRLLVAAVPVCAKAQNPKVSEDDAKKVVTIISVDKVKTKTYCDILKLTQQIEQAYEKNDRKMVDELSEKIATLEEALGPEYLALVNGLQDRKRLRQLAL
jgi:hypothetical protein